MLRDADFPWEVRPIVESHHECWDGSGYPHGLPARRSRSAARIFCVADVYDALVSRRPFKHVLSREKRSTRCDAMWAVSSTPPCSASSTTSSARESRSQGSPRRPLFRLRRLPTPRSLTIR
ncbi:MAG: HD domain-containing protein, partial [Brachymonas sp.]|nr:HD domain-containing protein [Brachymonas sp.]